MRNYAQIYYNQGFTPFPLGNDKAPVYGCMWKQWSREKLLKEFEREDVHGLGVKCDGFEVIDIDNKLGDAYDILRYILDNLEFSDDLTIIHTSGRGFHIPYICEYIEGNRKLAYKKDVYNEWQCVIETRGKGGYIATYPSKGYKPLRKSLYGMSTLSKEQRSQLIAVCQSLNDKPKEPKIHLPDLDANGIGVIMLAKSLLEQNGWKFHGHKVTRPGKRFGTSATFGYIAPGVFYCFSPNASPFEDMKAYSSFQVVMMLMFNGDFGRTKDYIREKCL